MRGGKQGPEMAGLACSRWESSGNDFKIIKLIELHNIFECI